MPIVWEQKQRTTAPASRGIAWDDEPQASGFWPKLRESLYNLSLGPVGLRKADVAREQLGAATRRAPGLEALPTLAETLFPLPTGLPAADAVRTAMAESERQNRAMLLGGTLAAPLDPTTYAFLPAAAIPNMAGRVAASAAVGAAPELVRPKPNPVAAMLQGALAGGLAAPSLRPSPRPQPRPALPENLPGVSPYSFLLPAERATAGEAGQAAQEGYAAMREAMPQPRPRPAIAEAPSLYPAERFKNIVWDRPGVPRERALVPSETIPLREGAQGGRIERPHERGFIELPSDEEMRFAARMAAGKSVAVIPSEDLARRAQDIILDRKWHKRMEVKQTPRGTWVMKGSSADVDEVLNALGGQKIPFSELFREKGSEPGFELGEGGFVSLPDEGLERAGAQAARRLSPFGFQDANQERVIHSRWDKGNEYRYHLEASGDIFRELALNSDKTYLNEKIGRVGRYLDRQKSGLHPDDTFEYSKSNNPAHFSSLERLWSEQPVANQNQQVAKELNLALVRGQFDKARNALSQIKSSVGERGFVALPEEEGAQRAGAQAVGRAAAGAVPPTPETAPSRIAPEAQTRAQKVVQALREARPVRRQQEALYTQERGARAGAVKAVRERVGGEQGYRAELSQLKGELPKAQYESIRSRVTQADIDELFNDVNRSSLDFWDTLPAKGGLVKMLEGRVPTHGELDILKRVFGAELPQELLAKRPLLEKLKSLGLEIANLPRSLTASFDLSAPLRQGVFLIGRPKQWIPALGSMFKQVFSEKNFQQSQAQIRARPTYQLMRDAKLQLTDIGETISLREEQFMAQLGERIPVLGAGVRASNRAYVGFLNRLRADVFDDLLKKGEQLGLEGDPEFLSSVSSFVNHATGRGNIGALERSAPLLNAIFFSPRLMMSRLQLLNPGYYIGLQPVVRKEAIKSLLSFVGTGSVVLGLAKLNGAEVGTDPRSADFGKMKFGNTRYDIWGGFQPLIRGAAQLITGEQISSTTGREMKLGEGYKPTTRLDIIQRWFGSKESPIASLATELLQGKTMTGEDVQLAPAIVDRFIPMFAQDVYDVMREQGIGKAWTALPSLFGVGVQTYGQQVPQITTTPSGRETVSFRQPPSLGETAVNALTGKKVSDVPAAARPALDRARQQEAVRKAEIDKAKRLTLEDGKRRRVGPTEIYLEKGIVKTRTRGRAETPQRIYERNVRPLRR